MENLLISDVEETCAATTLSQPGILEGPAVENVCEAAAVNCPEALNDVAAPPTEDNVAIRNDMDDSNAEEVSVASEGNESADIPNIMRTSYTSSKLRDVYLALLALFVAHIPNELLFANVIRIINILIPDEDEHLPVKLNQFLARCNVQAQPKKLYYCNTLSCKLSYIGTADNRCTFCGKLPAKSSYFLYNSITDYIHSLLTDSDLRYYLNYATDRTQEREPAYRDPRDGSEFQRIQSRSPGSIQLLLNADGVPLYKTTSYSLHPITVCPLNYPLIIRRKRLHCCILWNDKVKPNYSELFKPFIEEMTHLGTEGLVWINDNTITRTKVFLTLITADSVARAPLQQIQQFNGKYGCPVCVTPSTPLNKSNALHRIYNYRTQPVLRTSTDTLHIGKSAVSFSNYI